NTCLQSFSIYKTPIKFHKDIISFLSLHCFILCAKTMVFANKKRGSMSRAKVFSLSPDILQVSGRFHIWPPPRPRHISDAMVHTGRSEEHTSELQSRFDLVCRLLLEKKNTTKCTHH